VLLVRLWWSVEWWAECTSRLRVLAAAERVPQQQSSRAAAGEREALVRCEEVG
jgi:hypothetical protein